MHYYKLFYNFFNKNLSGTAEHHEVSRRSSWVLTDYHADSLFFASFSKGESMLAAAFYVVPSFSPRAHTKLLKPFKPDISNPAEPQLRCALYTSESCQILPQYILTPELECAMGRKKGRAQKALPNYF